MPDGVLKQRVKSQIEPLPVGTYRDPVQPAELPAPVGGGPPAADQFHCQPVERDELRMQELRVRRRGDDEQPLGDPPQPVELADHDPDVLAFLLACQVAG